MTQAARTTSPVLGWTVLVAATVAVIMVLIVTLLPPAATGTPAWKTLPAPAALPTADQSGLAPVGDIQMWYAVFNRGGGNPVLLIHGGLENADTWGNQVPVLAQTHEVIIADSRGHVRSTRSDKPFGYELMADDYVGLLDHLMVDKVALVGWSDGAIIGLDIAMRHPERLTKLWAYGANFNIGGLVPGFDKDPVFSREIANAGERYRRVSPTPDQYDAFVEAISAMWNSQPDFTRQQLGLITTPTMIVDGEYDEAIKREHTEELARLIPNAKFLIMPGVSHFGHLQNPQLYNTYLTAFLDFAIEMSYDLMVFDPKVPPPDRAGFMAWYREQEQVQREDGYDCNNPANCSPELAAWFFDIKEQFPAINGPYADLSGDEAKSADYIIGRTCIYVCFSWSEFRNAHRLAFELAKKHGLGFFNVSEKDGEVWAPQPNGLYACIHGTGAAFASNPDVRVSSIAKVQVIKKNKH